MYPEKGQRFGAEPALGLLVPSGEATLSRGCAELPVPLPQSWAWISCSSPSLSEQPGTHLGELP